MKRDITYVGLDAHKRSIQVAVFRGDEKALEWQTDHTAASVAALAKRLKKVAKGSEIRSCYEAGPCGFALQRRLRSHGIACDVVAPGLIPQAPGDRIKTDKRDAMKLGKYLRGGLLTIVHPPTLEQEAVRSIVRAREDAVVDRNRQRNRLNKFLDRIGTVHYEGTKWTQRYHKFLKKLKFDNEDNRFTFESYLDSVDKCAQTLELLERQMKKIAERPEYKRYVDALRTFRGIDTVTAMTIVAELGDVHRFAEPRQFMSYLGLVPSEHSSGGKKRRGPITKVGNGHIRRVVIESAWHNRHRAHVGAKLKKRREGQPDWVIRFADKAMSRLNHRYQHLQSRGLPSQKTNVAVGRELAGFIWGLFREIEQRA